MLKEYEKVQKKQQSNEEEIKAFRSIVRGAAAIDKVEVLAVVVEEQRLRIDSILQGSHCIALYHMLLLFFIIVYLHALFEQDRLKFHRFKRN